MPITSTQTQHHIRNIAVGRYLTTDAAIEFDITIGFKPRYVKVVNVTDRTMLEWYEGMADASAIKTTVDNVRTIIATLGITPLNNGFTLGLDTGVNVQSKQLNWVAMG